MQLTRIHLKAYRNHNDTALEFSTGTNTILGDNGQGKTNIIEAISYLCLTKSFYASSDAVVLGLGREAFEVEGVIVSDANVESHVRVVYVLASKEKLYLLNKRRIEPFSSIIGRFPIVILSPEHAPITLGPPVERRKFLDLVISQFSASYFEDLVEYHRTLKQRNKVLLDAKIAKTDPGVLLEPWDQQLLSMGSRLMYRRKRFVNEFQSYITTSYHHITDDIEEPGLNYAPGTYLEGTGSEEEIREMFWRDLQHRRREEVHLGTTLVGPHRDEVAFTINGLNLRKYASQGQHKTFLIALKMSEFFYLKEHCGEIPIMLLDDVFSELDEHRAKRVMNFVGELSQSFLTSSTSAIFDDATACGERNRKFFVSNGTVIYENA